MRVKKVIWSIIICISLLLMIGCNKKEISVKKVKDVDYTVVEQIQIPTRLANEIASKKENGFKLTYKDGEYMYIAVGYGKQDTGGYSITVKDVFLSKNAVYVNTSLIGPKENDLVLKANTYPYIVLKIEDIDMNVVFH